MKSHFEERISKLVTKMQIWVLFVFQQVILFMSEFIIGSEREPI